MCRRTHKQKRNGTSPTCKFPGKLHEMLSYVEDKGLEHVISWTLNGRGFQINDPEELVTILPRFFEQTKYRSFRRQINMWHFDRVLDGPHRGVFVHPYFVKGNKKLCDRMSRQSQPEKSLYVKSISECNDDIGVSYLCKVGKENLFLLNMKNSSTNSLSAVSTF